MTRGQALRTVRCRLRGHTMNLEGGQLLAAGGEGRILALPECPGLVAKVFHPGRVSLHQEQARATKLAYQVEHPPSRLDGLSWPMDLLEEEGRIIGLLMPRLVDHRPIGDFSNPKTRRRHHPLFNSQYLVRTAHNLSAAFSAVHEAGYVVGDVNESNAVVHETALVRLVDSDSFQVTDSVAGTVFRCRVGRPEFTPPELQGVCFSEVDRHPCHDRFGLAVLIFQLLMEGQHPFAGAYSNQADDPPLEWRIQQGHFPFSPHSPCQPALGCPPLTILHPGLQNFFRICFVEGHRDPSMRPSAQDWIQALKAAEADLTACRVNPQHRFDQRQSNCPWCARARTFGRDPFPGRRPAAKGPQGQAPTIVSAPPPQPAPAPSPASPTQVAPTWVEILWGGQSRWFKRWLWAAGSLLLLASIWPGKPAPPAHRSAPSPTAAPSPLARIATMSPEEAKAFLDSYQRGPQRTERQALEQRLSRLEKRLSRQNKPSLALERDKVKAALQQVIRMGDAIKRACQERLMASPMSTRPAALQPAGQAPPQTPSLDRSKEDWVPSSEAYLSPYPVLPNPDNDL